MDKFPLLWDGKPVGELTAEREALYTWFEARCRLPEKGLWCAWAVGDRGELRLGVLEPCGDRAAIRRRFSAQLTGPVGRLQWGELRPAHPAEPGDWLPAERAADLFRSPGSGSRCRTLPASSPGGRRSGGMWLCPTTRCGPFHCRRCSAWPASAGSAAGTTWSTPLTRESGRYCDGHPGQFFQKKPNGIYHIAAACGIIPAKQRLRSVPIH